MVEMGIEAMCIRRTITSKVLWYILTLGLPSSNSLGKENLRKTSNDDVENHTPSF